MDAAYIQVRWIVRKLRYEIFNFFASGMHSGNVHGCKDNTEKYQRKRTTVVAILTGDEQRVGAAGLTPWRWNQECFSGLSPFIIPCSVSQEIPGGQLDTEGVSHLEYMRRPWMKKLQWTKEKFSHHQHWHTNSCTSKRCRTDLPSLFLLHTSRVSITIFPRALRDTF